MMSISKIEIRHIVYKPVIKNLTALNYNNLTILNNYIHKKIPKICIKKLKILNLMVHIKLFILINCKISIIMIILNNPKYKKNKILLKINKKMCF
jgi:hypothetical protein